MYKDVLVENIKQYRASFQHYRGGFTLACSVKSNPTVALLKLLREENVMAEVCSLADMTAAGLAGYTGDQILFDGLVKSDVELTKALESKISIVNLESFGEAQRLVRIAEEAKQKVNVGIRLSFPSSRVGLKSLLGISYDRFGASQASGEAARIAEFVLKNKYLNLIGLHCHTGSNHKSARGYLVGIDELVAFMVFLRQQYGVEIKLLNLGGGFGIPEITAYKVTDLAKQAIARFLGQPMNFSHRPTHFEQRAQQIIAYLEEQLTHRQLELPHLMLEPGRSLVGNTTHLLTTIVERKETKHNNWMIIDAGTNLLPVLTIYSEYHDIVVFTKNREQKKTSIAGPLLYSSDIIVSGRTLPQGQVGEIVMICDVGAYFNCQANQFLYPRAATVLIEATKPRLIQRRETVADLFVRDVF
jgi:diaminopimelate decarboxylase